MRPSSSVVPRPLLWVPPHLSLSGSSQCDKACSCRLMRECWGKERERGSKGREGGREGEGGVWETETQKEETDKGEERDRVGGIAEERKEKARVHYKPSFMRIILSKY